MGNKCTLTMTEIIIYTIVLGAVASFSHFAYELSGKNQIVGFFNPVNESVWEHLKFMFFPFLIWWVVIYLAKIKTCEISLNTWIVSAAISLVVAPLSVVLLYYGYTGALGIESTLIDVLLTFICYFIALCIGAHFLEYLEPIKWAPILSVAVVTAIFILFIVFTIKTPELPIFHENNKPTNGSISFPIVDFIND